MSPSPWPLPVAPTRGLQLLMVGVGCTPTDRHLGLSSGKDTAMTVFDATGAAAVSLSQHTCPLSPALP